MNIVTHIVLPAVSIVQFSSVNHVRHCDPMDCSTPGLPVHYQLPSSRPSSQWCHPAISSSVIPFSSCLQSLPASGSFSNESILHFRWPKYWSFNFSISPSKECSGLISFRMDWLDLLAVQGTQESSPTPQFNSINSLGLSFCYGDLWSVIFDVTMAIVLEFLSNEISFN